MTVGGDAFDDRLNKFNPSMNRGFSLSRWFASEFGSTQCRKITGCDFSDPSGVSGYIDGDQLSRCRTIGCRVAAGVVLLGAVLAIAFLPARAAGATDEVPVPDDEGVDGDELAIGPVLLDPAG